MAYGGPPTRIQYRRESVSLEPVQAFHRSVNGLHSTLRRYTLLRSAFPRGKYPVVRAGRDSHVSLAEESPKIFPATPI